MAQATLRYWAAAKAAAGIHEERVEAATLAGALGQARQRHVGDPHFAGVLARSSILIDGVAVGSRPHDQVMLGDGATIEVLPPFAGG